MKYLLLAFLSILLLPTALFAQAPAHKSLVGVSGWVVFWDGGASLQDFEKYAYWTDRVYILGYQCGENGMPVVKTEAADALRARAVAAARKGKCQPWLAIDGWGTGGTAVINRTANGLETMLKDGALRQQHIATLIALAKKEQVDGIQIRYGSMDGRYRGALSSFTSELSSVCHQNGLLLGAVVYGKNEDRGGWWGPEVFDYKALGGVVDEMVAGPGMRGDGDVPGPMGDLVSTEVNMRYMTSVVPASKTEVSAAALGFDWLGIHGQEVSWAQFQSLIQQYRVAPGRDTEASEELYLNYPPGHEVWFEDAKSVEFVADIAKRLQAYGIAFWHFGTEGLEFWQMVRRADSSNQPTALTGMPPSNPVPRKLHPIDIYSDLRRELNIWAAGGEESQLPSNISAMEKSGKHWFHVKLNPTVWATFGVNLAATNLKPYLEHGALQFYVRGMQGGETFNFGFSSAPGLKSDEKYALQDLVPVDTYGGVTTQWKLITIPLADFSASGHHSDAFGQDAVAPFNWTRVIEVMGMRGPGTDQPVEFEISNVRVVPSYK